LFAPGISGRGDLAPTVCWAGNRGYSIRIWYQGRNTVMGKAIVTANAGRECLGRKPQGKAAALAGSGLNGDTTSVEGD
jgi:hypothetical protein